MKCEHEHHKHCCPPEYPLKQHHYKPPHPHEECECECCNDNEKPIEPTEPVEPDKPTEPIEPDIPTLVPPSSEDLNKLLAAATLFNNERCKVRSLSLPIEETSFEDIYSLFLDKVTEDMYMEMTEEDTKKILESLLINSLIWFEFPRFELDNYSLEDKIFFSNLTFEEKDIIATYMVVEWLGQQLASVENVRMKYSGSIIRPRYLEINK